MATVAKIQAELDLDTGRFAGAVVSAIGNVRKFDAAVSNTDKSLKRIEGRVTSLGASLRDSMVVLGQFRAAMHTLWMFTGQWVGAIIEANSKLERLQILMRGLSRASTEADKVTESLKNMNYVLDKARNAPFAVDEIANAFVKMKASGIDPTKGALDSLMDAVARFGGDDQVFHRATIAIQQMAGKGVVSMEELRQQLGEAIPNAMVIMARSTGMTMAEMVKTISTGRLAFDKALQDKFFQEMSYDFKGSAERMMDSWVGLIAKLKTEWMVFAKEIGDQGLFDGAKKSLGDLIAFMGSSQGKALAKEIGQALGDAAVAAGNLARWLIENRDEVIAWGKLLAQIFVTKKLAEFGLGLVQTGFKVVELTKGIGGLSTAMAAARAGTAGWSAVIGAAAGPIGIAVVAISGLIFWLDKQKAAAMRAADAMRDYHDATANGMAVSAEEHIAAQERINLLLKVKKAIRDYENMDQRGIAGYDNGKRRKAVNNQILDLMPELREKGFITYNSSVVSDHMNGLDSQIGELRKIIDEKWEEVSSDGMQQASLQAAARAEKAIGGFTDKVSKAVESELPELTGSLNDLWEQFNSGEMKKSEYQAKRQDLITTVLDAKLAGWQTARDTLKKQYDGMAADSVGAQNVMKLINQADTQLEQLRESKTSLLSDDGPTLLPGMGGNGKGAKANPLAEYLETVIGKHAQLKAQLDDGNPTLEKFNAMLAAGAYGKNANSGMVARIQSILEANQKLAEEIKKNSATDKLTQELEELDAKAGADVISAKLESTGDLYSQVSAGMVGFNRQIAVLGNNLEKTNMSREEFEKWVVRIKENIAEVDFLNLQKFVADQEFEAYLNSLPKRERDLAEFNKRLEENRRMIEQMKANDPDNTRDAEYDALGARNEAAIRQEYANATKPAWQNLIDEWQDTTTAMDNLWANSMQRMADTLVEAVTTGKASFKDLATYILKEITRILISKAVAQLAQMVINMFGGGVSAGGGSANFATGAYSAAGYANGGVHTQYGSMPLHKYATGGVANTPQMAIFGEGRKPEAYVPLPDGRTIPVTMEGGGGGVVNQVSISIEINQDGSTKSDTTASNSEARQLGGLIDGRVRETLTKELQPGGILWRMRNGGN